MTTTPNKPCETSADCLHPTCRHCQKLLRTSFQLLEDHPGTVQGTLGLTVCSKHRNKGNPDTLTDQELAYLKDHHPHAYAFHARRRRNHIPPMGLKLTGEYQ